MKLTILRRLACLWLMTAIFGCTGKPREGLYYCAGNILEVAMLKDGKIAFQIISKRNRQTRYISGKARPYKEKFFVSTELSGNIDTNKLFFEFKPGQIRITENSVNPSQKLFEGVYDFFSADKLRPESTYLWNASYLQPKP
ncbi:hypothetical protein [Rhodoflexus sp.]